MNRNGNSSNFENFCCNDQNYAGLRKYFQTARYSRKYFRTVRFRGSTFRQHGIQESAFGQYGIEESIQGLIQAFKSRKGFDTSTQKCIWTFMHIFVNISNCNKNSRFYMYYKNDEDRTNCCRLQFNMTSCKEHFGISLKLWEDRNSIVSLKL